LICRRSRSPAHAGECITIQVEYPWQVKELGSKIRCNFRISLISHLREVEYRGSGLMSFLVSDASPSGLCQCQSSNDMPADVVVLPSRPVDGDAGVVDEVAEPGGGRMPVPGGSSMR
jgi:hypothetical protein